MRLYILKVNDVAVNNTLLNTIYTSPITPQWKPETCIYI